MRGSVARVLARAASAMALVSVTRAMRGKPNVSPEERMRATHLTARRIYKNLKARWTGTPRRERHAVRRELLNLTDRAHHSLELGQA